MKKPSKQDEVYILYCAKKIKAINFLGGKCVICGNNNIFSLEFHHIAGDKDFTISSIRNNRWSVIENEIKKCELLCSNCHSEKHYRDAKNGKIKSDFMINNNFLNCSRCNYRGGNFASLSFHHIDPKNKKFGLNSALSRKIKVSIQDILDEVQKCIILCRNCHNNEHMDRDKFRRLKKYIDHKIKNYVENILPLDKNIVWDMCINRKMKQMDVAKYFSASKGTISDIIKRYAIENKINIPKRNIVRDGNKVRIKRLIKTYNCYCENCDKKFKTIRRHSKFCSVKCMGSFKRAKNRPSQKQLIEMKKTMSLSEISKKYNVSRIAVYFWINPDRRKKMPSEKRQKVTE